MSSAYFSEPKIVPTEFAVASEHVCVLKLTDPLLASELHANSAKLTAYVEKVSRPIIVVADFSQITRISPDLISVGLQRGPANPLRNPAIAKSVIITQLPIIQELASVVSKVLGINKLIVVENWDKANKEVEMFLRQQNLPN